MKVIFIKDFATKKKGDEFDCDGMLASRLINVDKVAKKKDSKPKAKAKSK
jgi:hypothetical protein